MSTALGLLEQGWAMCCKGCTSKARSSYGNLGTTPSPPSPKRLRHMVVEDLMAQIKALKQDAADARQESTLMKSAMREQSKALGFTSKSKKIQDLKPPTQKIRSAIMHACHIEYVC